MMNDYDFEREVDNLLTPYMIRCARSGCIKSGGELARLAASYIAAGEKLPETLRQFIVDGLNAESPDKGLFLKHEEGVGDTPLYRWTLFAAAVRALCRNGRAKNVTDACRQMEKLGVAYEGKTFYEKAPEIRKHYYEVYPKKTALSRKVCFAAAVRALCRNGYHTENVTAACRQVEKQGVAYEGKTIYAKAPEIRKYYYEVFP